MDRNLHTDDFERLLREKSDEFRMYPSKRIWYSIYNNIHPGRRWPSVVMSLVLTSALVLIGYLNTNDSNILIAGNGASNKNFAENSNFTFYTHPFEVENNSVDQKGIVAGNSFTFTPPTSELNQSSNSFPVVPQITNSSIVAGSRKSPNIILAGTNSTRALAKAQMDISSEQPTASSLLFENNYPIIASIDNNKISTEGWAASALSRNISTIERVKSEKSAATDERSIDVNNNSTELSALAINQKSVVVNKLMPYSFSTEENEWINNYAFYNRPAPKKWAGKLAWQIYATPSVVYRVLRNSVPFDATSNSIPQGPYSGGDVSNDVIQKPSLGLEVGTGLQYPIFKGAKLKGGFQLNFTQYNSIGFHNTHPVATKLTMNDYATRTSYELLRATPYSNRTGLDPVKLHNQTFQVSIPLGVDFKLMGNEAIQWNVGVTMQPTLLIAGKSYLISSDRRNYVKETSMLNRFNLNAGFETFVSYKSDNGITYTVGPEFRTQLFSTNVKSFAVQEKLLTYGIKFGIIKTLK